jgi:hypothetical protein
MTLVKIAAVVAVAVALVAAAASAKNVRVLRCDDTSCQKNCSVVVEFVADQCHPDERGRFWSRGEILRPRGIGASRLCFREDAFDARGDEGCSGPLLASEPRECNVCVPEVHPYTSKYKRYSGCGTSNFSVSRGCDFGCNSCDVTIPLPDGQCLTQGDIAFKIQPFFSCGGAGWDEIQAEHFFSAQCDYEPDFVNSVFENLCYVDRGRGFYYDTA